MRGEGEGENQGRARHLLLQLLELGLSTLRLTTGAGQLGIVRVGGRVQLRPQLVPLHLVVGVGKVT